jgi:parvulin-like peptidyl-prolyl isomerase
VRNKSFYAWLMAAVLAGFVLETPATGKTVDEVVLVVNQEALTRGELEESIHAYFIAQNLKLPKPGAPEYEAAKKEIIEGYIREVVLAGEADRMRIVVSEGELEHEVNQELEKMKKGFPTEADFEEGLRKEGMSLEELKQDIREKLTRRIKAGRILRAKQQEIPEASSVRDDEAKQYFNQHLSDYEQARFSIILFRIPPGSKSAYAQEVERQAQEVLKELKAGADFVTYAKKYSEDKGTAEKGGEVGTVFRAELDPRLAKGIFAIPVKGLGLVKSSEGVYVVKISAKSTADFASMAPEIKDRLRKGKQDSVVQQWIKTLKKKAFIVLDGKTMIVGDSDETGKDLVASAKPAASNSAVASKTQPEQSAGPSSSGTSTDSSDKPAAAFYNLPKERSFVLDVGAAAWLYGTKYVTDYYAPGIGKVDLPLGIDLNVGAGLALDSQLQVGLLLEVLSKRGFTVTSGPNSESWIETAGGALARARFLAPLNEGINLALSASGGYYILFDSKVVSAGGSTAHSPLNGSGIGGQAFIGVEFFLDENRGLATSLSGGYRYLTISTTTGTGSIESNKPIDLDFSGPKFEAALRFYLDQE